jgi:mannosyltransferase
VHLGLDSDSFYPDPAIGDGEVTRVVLFVGQRTGYKRFDLAVAALERLPSLSLGIVGPALSSTERLMVQERLPGRWKDYGSVDNVRLRQLYSSAHSFVFPSDYEGFGLPVLEAMACGCPVVAAARSSLPEVGGSAARYAQSQTADAYASELEALDSMSVRSSAVAAGMIRAQEFSWRRTVEGVMAVHNGN